MMREFLISDTFATAFVFHESAMTIEAANMWDAIDQYIARRDVWEPGSVVVLGMVNKTAAGFDSPSTVNVKIPYNTKPQTFLCGPGYKDERIRWDCSQLAKEADKRKGKQ